MTRRAKGWSQAIAPDEATDVGSISSPEQRIDVWLWYARCAKSRTLAQTLVSGGRVRINKQRIAKAATMVRPGDVVTLSVGPRVRVLKIVGVGTRRGPAAEAALLYTDCSPVYIAPDAAVGETSAAALQAGQREAGSGRPTKRDRRLIDRLKGA